MVEVESGVEDVLIDVEGSSKFVSTDETSVECIFSIFRRGVCVLCVQIYSIDLQLCTDFCFFTLIFFTDSISHSAAQKPEARAQKNI